MTLLNFAAFTLCALLPIASRAELPKSPSPPAGADRITVFVSDLHMGVGRDPDHPNKWHNTEDFRWHGEFDAFLKEMDKRGKGRVDLVLVGDILELWQHLGSPSCDHGDDRGCNEEDAVKRATRVVEQHRAVFESLRGFVSADNENYVTLVPGNHDVALVFEEVRTLVLKAIAANPSGRVRVASEGYWRSADGKVIAEHGQQVGADLNRFEGWPLEPFVTVDGVKYLRQSWGENFVQKIFNAHEENYPVIDNLSSESLGARYASKHLGFKGTAREVGRFGRFIVFQQTWSQAGRFLGDERAVDGEEPALPTWDIGKIDAGESAKCWRFLAASLEPDDPIAAQIADSADAMPEKCELSVEQVTDACNRRYTLAQQAPEAAIELCPVLPGAPPPKLGALAAGAKGMFNSRARANSYQERLRDLRDDLPPGDRPVDAFTFYVYGHTHQSHESCTPFASKETWKPQVINDGAWQRTADERVFCALSVGKDPKTVLADLRPEDLPACYPFVIMEGNAKPALKYWVQRSEGEKGAVKNLCTDEPPIPAECEAKADENVCPHYPEKSEE